MLMRPKQLSIAAGLLFLWQFEGVKPTTNVAIVPYIVTSSLATSTFVLSVLKSSNILCFKLQDVAWGLNSLFTVSRVKFVPNNN